MALLLVSCSSGGPETPGPAPSNPAPGLPSPGSRSAAAATTAIPIPASSTQESPQPAPSPQFAGSIAGVDAARLTHSWHQGCPVEVADLRLLTVSYWGFGGEIKTGELVVHRDQAQKILKVMQMLFAERFPIERMKLIDNYEGDDDKSMAANNTSAFNCRAVDGRPGVWSQHAFGRAVDINPLQNPYVSASGKVSPPSGAAFLDRSQKLPGMIHSNDSVLAAFASIGWEWGGLWTSPDYQHFSANGK
jgi:hypothetical protein